MLQKSDSENWARQVLNFMWPWMLAQNRQIVLNQTIKVFKKLKNTIEARV